MTIKERLESIVEKRLRINGFVADDPHLCRKVLTVNAVNIEIIDQILLQKILDIDISALDDKYWTDYGRMAYGLGFCIREYNKNPNSRQLVTFNNASYYDILQCFLSVQFIREKEGRITQIVYQRSGDKSKFYEDVAFFGTLGREFEQGTGTRVVRMSLFYGSLHREIS